MNSTIGHRWLLLLCLVCGCAKAGNPRERLASALSDSLAKAADPEVAFRKDSTHLLVELATVAFPTVSDSLLTYQARDVAQFALRHYERANELDSVTVLYREESRPGVWYIRHTRTFPAGDLRNIH
jgi:O-acetyl-ADP-ribose deacetylase (regulator of RNase III)